MGYCTKTSSKYHCLTCCRFVVYVNNEQKTTDVKANDGNWHHIVFTWSSNRGVWKIYIDGVKYDTGYGLAEGQVIQGRLRHSTTSLLGPLMKTLPLENDT